MKIYISGALDAAADLNLARRKYDEIASQLQDLGFHPYVPHHNTDPVFQSGISASDVFERDLRALVESQIIVAFFDEPSLGVGSEVAIALARGIPVIGLIAENRKFSRFLEGMIITSPNSAVFRYSDLYSAVIFLKDRFPLENEDAILSFVLSE